MVQEVTQEVAGDKEWLIRHWFGDHTSTLYFKVHEIEAWDDSGTLFFEHADRWEQTEKPDEAEVFLDGAVKWDGCSNWTFGGKTQVHICGPEGVNRLKALFDRMYVIAQERMPGYRFMGEGRV